jgi:hypothetical protein
MTTTQIGKKMPPSNLSYAIRHEYVKSYNDQTIFYLVGKAVKANSYIVRITPGSRMAHLLLILKH